MATKEKDQTSFNPLGKRKPRKKPEIVLRLTSMIDMFTILLVYILINTSSDPEVMAVAADLELPLSSSQKPPKTSSIVAITRSWILVDGKQVITTNQVLASSTLLIPELQAELKQLRAINEKVGEISSQLGFTGKISIQGDRDLDYQVIKKVMFTCGQVGYNDMMLAVTQEE
jgi:biopolymer transport protein ExbD